MVDQTAYIKQIRDEIFGILGKDPKVPPDIIDPHKLCEIDTDVATLKEDYMRVKTALDGIEKVSR